MNDKQIIAIVVLIAIAIGITVLVAGLMSIKAKAKESDAGGGLSEQVKQNADGTKVSLKGEKIDVDITKGITRYQNGTGSPILNGYITNFTPDRIVTNMLFELTFANNHMLIFPLNHANTVISILPWQTLLWNHILSPDEQAKVGNPANPNSYSTQVLYNEIDIYKQHNEQQQVILKK